MPFYILMGTHLTEVRHCIQHLIGSIPENKPFNLHIPKALNWPTETADLTIHPYETSPTTSALENGPHIHFILIDPRLSPVPQLEALAETLKTISADPDRILTCVDCAQVEATPSLKGYYEACIYYSDVVLLGNRADASKSFVRDYQKHYEKHCYPCLFLLLKGPGIPEKPLEILTPGTRRLSQLFDLAEEAIASNSEIDASCDLDLDEPEQDPYRQSQDEDASPQNVPDATPFVRFVD